MPRFVTVIEQTCWRRWPRWHGLVVQRARLAQVNSQIHRQSEPAVHGRCKVLEHSNSEVDLPSYEEASCLLGLLVSWLHLVAIIYRALLLCGLFVSTEARLFPLWLPSVVLSVDWPFWVDTFDACSGASFLFHTLKSSVCAGVVGLTTPGFTHRFSSSNQLPCRVVVGHHNRLIDSKCLL